VAQLGVKAVPGDLLDEETEDQVVRVRILEVLARREVRRLVHPAQVEVQQAREAIARIPLPRCEVPVLERRAIEVVRARVTLIRDAVRREALDQIGPLGQVTSSALHEPGIAPLGIFYQHAQEGVPGEAQVRGAAVRPAGVLVGEVLHPGTVTHELADGDTGSV